mgnify:CR=1 FL=1
MRVPQIIFYTGMDYESRIKYSNVGTAACGRFARKIEPVAKRRLIRSALTGADWSRRSPLTQLLTRGKKGGERGLVHFAFNGVEMMEHAHAVLGARTGDVDHPVLSFCGRDHDLIGPGDHLGGGGGAFGQASDIEFG